MLMKDYKKKIETIPLIVAENQYKNIQDKKNIGGFVTIIDADTKEVLVNKKSFSKLENVKGKDNLILYSGREVLAQKLFNKERITGSGDLDLFVSWFGLGTGGADANDPLNPIEPETHDTGLANEIVIDVNNPAYADSGKKKPIDSIEFLQDPENEDRWLLVKASILVTENDANGNDLSEAMLYLSDTTNPITASRFVPWARVTFSTIRKYDHRRLLVLWYIYF